ncbi:hypothetical protein BGZ96_008555 [Linnemannia gamsii]|uniref:Chitinase n=1 Tax=Linnemannia gamsii TaxID=64522 RepID=A0ABQ7K021_9FUNG|nr:hypothetical protein BGZ96_008555 [Linnemannia gamsii]
MVFGRRRAYTAFLVTSLLVLLLLLLTTGEARARNKDKDKDNNTDKGSDAVLKKHGGDNKEQRGGLQEDRHTNHHDDKNQRLVNKADRLKNTKPKDLKGNKQQKQDVDDKKKNRKGHETKNMNKNRNKKKNKKNDGGRQQYNLKDKYRHGSRQSSMSTDILCGPGRDRCPSDKPCCSQWGFCGNEADYCLAGCQGAFGLCRLDEADPTGASTPKTVHHHHHRTGGKVRLGFNLQDKQQQFPNQNGRQFRIPATTASNKLPPNGTLVNIAYFPGWTQYRGLGRNNCHQRPYLPSSIPWSSLDYVMFAFVYFDDFHQLYPADTSDEALYFEINRLKMATGTRVMISIGGWSFTHPENKREASTMYRFENMIRSPESRKVFTESCIEFCQFYGFDGVDIDYEYPAYKDRRSVTALFKEMREAFDAEGSGLVLSLAGASFQEGIQGFELEKVAEYTDFVMIMSYDLYGAYDAVKVVNIHTTLIQMPTEKHSGHSVQGAIEMYLDNGVHRNKIVVGLALYGKTFVLSDITHPATPGRAAFKDGGDPTSCIATRGDMAYNELAGLIHPPQGDGESKVTPLWDNDGKAFYFVYGNRRYNWVGYDDRPSLDLKLQMVTELDLAGVMWWSLDQDLDSTSDTTAMSIRKKEKKEKHSQKQKERKKAGSVQRRAIPHVPYRVLGAEQTHSEVGAESSHVVDPVQAVELVQTVEAASATEEVPLAVDIAAESSSTAEPAHAVELTKGAEQAAFKAPEALVEQGPGAVKVDAAPPGSDRSPPGSDRSPPVELTTPQLPTAYPPFPSPIAAVPACPQPATVPPPASLATIPFDALGRPGLVPYVASKRKRCPVVIKYPLVLPEAPVGNTVVIKCSVPPGCPETWQAYTCLSAEGDWSAPGPCYDKAQLSPSLYFYGELELVRTKSRDRNADDGGSASSTDTKDTSMGTSKMSSQIGPTRPQYIEEYQKFTKMQKLLGKAKGKAKGKIETKGKGREGHGIRMKKKHRTKKAKKGIVVKDGEK